MTHLSATLPPQNALAEKDCKACGATLVEARSLGRKNGYDLLPCAACGTVTVDPFPTAEELMRFYQAYEGSTDYRAKAEKKISRARKRLRRLIPLAPGKTFLDVGCNYGFTVEAALQLDLDARGIDIDDTAVRASKEMFGFKHFETVSVQDYAARGAKTDMIYTSEVIEHVPDPDGFMAALARLLNPGGVLYLTTPDGGHFTLPRDFASWKAVMPPEHITYFTRLGLKHLLEKHGLEVVKFFFSLKPGIQVIARKK